MAYPELLLKGIPNENYINEEGQIASSLFDFNKQVQRNDNYNEESIFWKDDDGAVELILTQQKSGQIQFKEGAAVIEKIDIDRIIKLPHMQAKLAYERNPIDGNPYHGNILLDKDVTKQTKRYIAGTIALFCKEIIPQRKAS